ncbi:MAG: hypothetical protein M1819_001078 [Sarea resinae]|nr:MAG: hypothetical protein M1819_001078 [Sarea resinae]
MSAYCSTPKKTKTTVQRIQTNTAKPSNMSREPIVSGWVDVHCHFTPPMNSEQLAQRYQGMCDAGWVLDKPYQWSLQHTLEYMDTRGIAMQMLSNIPQDLEALRLSNNYGARLVSDHPTRFGFLAALPTNDGAAMLAEIGRASDELNPDGFAVTCCYNGIYLGDPSQDIALAELDRRRAVVFVHPNAYCEGSFGRPAASLDVAFETARTMTNMIYSGAFRRFPHIKWIIAHCGGAFPALCGRLCLLGTESWVANPNKIRAEEMEDQVRRLYFDTAATATCHTLDPALAVTSPSHLLYGSDSGVPCSSDATLDRNLKALLTYRGLTPSQIEDVGSKNALALFPQAAARIARLYTESDIVATTSGLLRGSFEDNVYVFRGVPYAQPPVDELRFKAPRRTIGWPGIRPATADGPASFQVNNYSLGHVAELMNSLDPGLPGIMSWPSYTTRTYNQDDISEDCLYLNIWAPKISSNKKLPVYLYYHGGANAVSSGSFHLERGANLAREENIIVVRPNYRLGALGWVHFGLISDKFPEAINLGLQDQIAALRWVYDEIENFGGDPENITVGGESCGATAVSHLLTHPDARRMVRRAVIQSLSPFNLWCTQQKEEATVIAQQYMQILEIDDPEKLKTIKPELLLATHNMLCRTFPPDANVAWRPVGGVIDGDWISAAPAESLSEQRFDKENFELIIGFAKDEWQFFRGESPTVKHGTDSDVVAVLAQVFGPSKTRDLFDTYKDLFPDHEPGLLLSDVMSMEFFKFSSLCIANNLSAQGIPVHVFQFAYDLPGLGGSLRAVHTGDTPFLFRNYTPEDLAMWPTFDGIDREQVARSSAAMGSLMGAFIRNGNPGPEWPAWDAESQTVLWFGTRVEARKQLLKEEFEAWNRLGVATVRDLEARLVRNVRRGLNVRSRAFCLK